MSAAGLCICCGGDGTLLDGDCPLCSGTGRLDWEATPKKSVVSFRDGDWMCSCCGDHQFARNIACRLCGTPKLGKALPRSEPGLGSAVSSFRDGDWMCAGCGDHQFARNTACRLCGAPKLNGEVYWSGPRPCAAAPQLEQSQNFSVVGLPPMERIALAGADVRCAHSGCHCH